ncbi:hypothetical protein HDU97_002855 [Phlyctochytrium planicorne]|nr:hypothetical protein HDU97_002855 [Phlyctochytrium planicorne]
MTTETVGTVPELKDGTAEEEAKDMIESTYQSAGQIGTEAEQPTNVDVQADESKPDVAENFIIEAAHVEEGSNIAEEKEGTPPIAVVVTENPTDTDVTEEIQDKDVEILRLRNRVAELEKEVESLKAKLATSSLDAVSTNGPKLNHATKARVNPRKPVQRVESEPSDTPKQSETASTHLTPESNEPVDVASPDFKKKIGAMGGVSAFGGFNPFAGGAPILKPRASNASRNGSTSSQDLTEFAVAAESEEEIRDWIFEKTGDVNAAKGSGIPLHEALKDGHTLCKLVSEVNSDKKQFKAKNGKFVMILQVWSCSKKITNKSQENVSNYVNAAESFGVSRNLRFTYDELVDAKGTPKVLANLLALKKLTEKVE